MDISFEQLHGGTLGNVKLFTMKPPAGETVRAVWKTQKKWERHADPDSWRREYDLYASGLGGWFTDALRWPKCYHSAISEDEIQLWTEYIDGVSGLDLTGDMYEQASLELGRFQGRLYAEKPAFLQALTNLSEVGYMKAFYHHYRSWPEVYDYIRSDDCEIPRHLCQMLTGLDNNEAGVFSRIEKLPVVLCHRDFWVTNIFHTADGIRLIDWDTAGWGYFGEDMASLLSDEADIEHMVEYYKRCVPAYYKGFSEYADISDITDDCVYELILLMFGYRIIEWIKFAETPEEKKLHLTTLQRVYEIGELK